MLKLVVEGESVGAGQKTLAENWARNMGLKERRGAYINRQIKNSYGLKQKAVG